jgi:BolA protein
MADGHVRQKIIDKLTHAFVPDKLEVIDESHLHAGHSGARPEGETHFRVKIHSARFDDVSLLQRHRLVNEILSEELAGPVHALAIEAKPS